MIGRQDASDATLETLKAIEHPIAKQALVLVNYGNGKGQDIYELSTKIIEDIKTKFGIELEREVNCI